jgi:class 3 adenylate cyclase
MKRDREPEEWLGIVFEFIKHVDQLVRAAKGKVVKRIGDALMVTFNDVHALARARPFAVMNTDVS